MQWKSVLAVWLCCLAAPALAQEQIAFERLAGFALAYEAGTPDRFIREYVPEGETVERWSQMQTHQRFPTLAGEDPVAYLQRVGAALLQACPDADPQITQGRVGPFRNAVLYGRCPRNATGPEPETFVLLAVSGREAMHVAQHAWRGAVDADAISARYGVLIETPLCGGAAGLPACP